MANGSSTNPIFVPPKMAISVSDQSLHRIHVCKSLLLLDEVPALHETANIYVFAGLLPLVVALLQCEGASVDRDYLGQRSPLRPCRAGAGRSCGSSFVEGVRRRCPARAARARQVRRGRQAQPAARPPGPRRRWSRR